MHDYKRSPLDMRDYVLSNHNQNYFYAAPDIFVRQLDVEKDDLLIIANKDFYQFYTQKDAVVFIKNKLLSGLLPLQVRDLMIENIEKIMAKRNWNLNPTFLAVILNMDFLDV